MSFASAFQNNLPNKSNSIDNNNLWDVGTNRGMSKSAYDISNMDFNNIDLTGHQTFDTNIPQHKSVFSTPNVNVKAGVSSGFVPNESSYREQNWFDKTFSSPELTPTADFQKHLNMDDTAFKEYMDANPKALNEYSEMKLNDAKARDLNSTDWAGGIGAASSAIGAGVGIASYFDQRKVNKTKISALEQNMKIAQQNRNDRTEFLSETRSALA